MPVRVQTEDFDAGRTWMHRPSTVEVRSVLNALASSVMRAIFSLDTAMSTPTQSALTRGPRVPEVTLTMMPFWKDWVVAVVVATEAINESPAVICGLRPASAC